MILADLPAQRSAGPCAQLLTIDAEGRMRRLPRAALASLFRPGDVVVANDAATLPASLTGVHEPSGGPIEVRLAGWVTLGDPTRFDAIAFGAGDHRMLTEDRPPPPPLVAGDRLALGALEATVERVFDPPRLFRLRFSGDRASILAGLARSGRPIQYAHAAEPLALSDVWICFAADPVAFERPSAGFALSWRMLDIWRRRGVGFATLTHAAGLSSTGCVGLDSRLPFDEPYRIVKRAAEAINRAKSSGGRIVAIGTTVVRALESAAVAGGGVSAGDGLARGRIGRLTELRIVDAILTGVHRPGESHYELLRAFAPEAALERISAALARLRFRDHEFGDSVLIERGIGAWRH
jgi:S-adenosylmethionine:tRNA ribosyltransferase-isomerase